MKRIIVSSLSALLLFAASCKKDKPQTPDPSCDEKMGEIDPVYIFLTLKDIYGLDSDTTNPLRDSVKLQENRIEEKYKILKTIRNFKSPQTDSIFNILHAVHADYYYLQHVYFTLTDSSLFHSDTGLQKIIKKYNLTLSSLDVFNPPHTSVILKACPIVNVNALAREIVENTNIPYARTDVIPNNIKHTYGWGYPHNKLEIIEDLQDSSNFVRIYIGWGDCLAGCIHNRTWEFKVSKDLSVKLLASYGR